MLLLSSNNPQAQVRAVGKELVGVETVDDWNALADALAARGHGRGAVYHLDELDA